MNVLRTQSMETETFKVGDVISFQLTDGEAVKAMAVKPEDDHMIFLFVDCLAKEYALNEEDSNRGGYIASDLRATLNGEILDRFPEEIKSRMVPFATGDLLRLPTEKEIFGVNEYAEDESEGVTQFEPMKERRNRIAFQGLEGAWEWYWLANKRKGSASYFAFVYYSGFAHCYLASDPLGVRPAFKI